jgi:hypothetical protein
MGEVATAPWSPMHDRKNLTLLITVHYVVVNNFASRTGRALFGKAAAHRMSPRDRWSNLTR